MYNSYIEEMVSINDKLIAASVAYYNQSEIMSNYEYDQLYDHLVELEKSTGVTLSNSVTVNTGVPGETSRFEKVKHISPMQSLKKTKSVDDLAKLLGDFKGCLSWKLDGLTVVLTYDGGELIQAATRGDGVIGEDITQQARLFSNIPLHISHKGKLILRGEALISYDEFNRIKSIEGTDFKNPRNLASGTVRSLDLNVLVYRRVRVVAFTLVYAEHCTFNSYNEQLNYLSDLGFETVDRAVVDSSCINKMTDIFTRSASTYDYPVDGIVLFIDDLNKQKELGAASNHPNYAIALKWQDNTYTTTVTGFIWNISHTGRINPVVTFEPVDIDGSTVQRASVCNIDYIWNMRLNIGDEIEVIKANMIIPQVVCNNTMSLTDINQILPKRCPKCGGPVHIENSGNTRYLVCDNNCANIESIRLFVSTLGVKSLGMKTLEKLHTAGVVDSRCDLFNLGDKRDIIESIDGIGNGLYSNIIREMSNISVPEYKILASLGISRCGAIVSKKITNTYHISDLISLSKTPGQLLTALNNIAGVGALTSEAVAEYLSNSANIDELETILNNVTIETAQANVADGTKMPLSGLNIVITGKLDNFKNRAELVSLIESNGGTVQSSVNNDTTYLICNTPSSSSKSKRAAQLGVRVITEQELLNMINS